MNIYTQCCGLVILIILRYFYDRCRKINVNTGRAFERVSRSVVFSLMMDILSIIAITYMDKLPILLVKIICKAYLCSLCWAALMAFGYVCADISSSDKDIIKWIYRLGFTGIVIIIIINGLPLSIYSEDRIVYSQKEDEYQQLFKQFCDSIAIESRKNDKLQMNMLPLRFRPYMTEFK